MDTHSQRSVERVGSVRNTALQGTDYAAGRGKDLARNMDADLEETVKAIRASGQRDRAAELEGGRPGEGAILTRAGRFLLGNYHMYRCRTADFSDTWGKTIWWYWITR